MPTSFQANRLFLYYTLFGWIRIVNILLGYLDTYYYHNVYNNNNICIWGLESFLSLNTLHFIYYTIAGYIDDSSGQRVPLVA